MTNYFTQREQKLLSFVKQKHGDQKRKYTNEPYWTHMLSMCQMIYSSVIHPTNIFHSRAMPVVLCHDLLEDTDCTDQELRATLCNCGYSLWEAACIVIDVIALTDVYTKESFPDLNRKARKELEKERMEIYLSPLAWDIKALDILDNAQSIKKYDAAFWPLYKEECKLLLTYWKGSNEKWWDLAIQALS